MNFRLAGAFITHILFPRACLHCRRDLEFLDENPLCPDCRLRLEPIGELYCRHCGLPLPGGGALCHDCRRLKDRDRKSCSVIRAAFVFNPEIRSVIHAFKYRSRPYLSKHLGDWLAGTFERYPELRRYGFVMAVPLSGKRERKRGFNQSKLLAEVLACQKKLVLLDGALERHKETLPQAKLSREERKENIKDAFKVTRPEEVKGRKILLVDDVSTTGETLERSALELKRAGAESVAAFVLAKEPFKR